MQPHTYKLPEASACNSGKWLRAWALEQDGLASDLGTYQMLDLGQVT